MKILLIEDTPTKKDAIEAVIVQALSQNANHPIISHAENLIQARRELCTTQFDLVIFDMYLPDGSRATTERDCSQDLITEFSVSKNYQTEAIALTQFEISEIEDIQSFNRAGITLVDYNESQDWVTALKQKLNRAAQSVKCDFLIFCALAKERMAFQDSDCQIGQSINISGMNCIEVKIGDSNGLIIKPHNMGLVNMAIIASKAIELFQPKIVAMSGICAGIKGESKYLDIIVGKICWEYQTGKWKDGEFKQEPYQADLSRHLQVDLEQSTECSTTLNSIRAGLFNTELATMKIKVAGISSGSAVIADEDMMQRIGHQHRKMAGLEMEMYSLYEAAAQSLCNPLCFGAKAVVDMGDSSKGDIFHDTGCLISARYTALMLQEQLKKLSA
jgi:nucleoside phosphorylase/CheY-like chemotaxis protein